MTKPPEIARLVADLQSPNSIDRDAAVARLRVAGARAVPRLNGLVRSTAPASVRAAALAALEGIDDPRTVDAALAAAADSCGEVAIAALGVLRGWVTRERGTRVLETLTAIALDTGRDGRVRLAALDALGDLPRDLVQPILEQADPGTEAVTGDDPDAARDWIATRGRTSPLSALHDLVVRAREREAAAATPRERRDWLTVRAAAHAALARRNSRVALYDLREAFDAAQTPLPLDFLAAVEAIGDDTCLEPLARAWTASPRETWWRARLADAARDLVKCHRLTARHPVIKRIRTRWPEFL